MFAQAFNRVFENRVGENLQLKKILINTTTAVELNIYIHIYILFYRFLPFLPSNFSYFPRLPSADVGAVVLFFSTRLPSHSPPSLRTLRRAPPNRRCSDGDGRRYLWDKAHP